MDQLRRWPRASATGLAALISLASACVPERQGSALASAPAMVSPAPAPTQTPAEAPPNPEAPPGPPPPPELPRGGRTLFPAYRLVGFCGTPGAPALGPLLDHPATKADRLRGYAEQYAGDRKAMPVFELVAVVVQAYGGADGRYRRRVDDAVVDEYLQAARQSKGLLLINIQPGQSDFMSEVQRFGKVLAEPDVGVALDPEWAMLPKQQPGKFYGQTTGDAINAVAEYLSAIVARGNLPEKALVFHQVNDYVVKGESAIKAYPGVALIDSVDGYGPKGAKINTYNFLMRSMPAGVHPGFKLFFDEDRQNGSILMTPSEVNALKPQPEYVMYE